MNRYKYTASIMEKENIKGNYFGDNLSMLKKRLIELIVFNSPTVEMMVMDNNTGAVVFQVCKNQLYK